MPSYRILTAVPELSLQQDDVIIVDPDQPYPVVLWRAVALNFATTAALLVGQGKAIQLDDEPSVSLVVAATVGSGTALVKYDRPPLRLLEA